MLLKVNKPMCYRDLDRITIFIGRILKYSANSKRPFDKIEFENYFGDAGRWIMNINKDTVKNGFNELFIKTPEECTLMQKAYYNDIKFAITPSKNQFQFHVPNLEEKLRITLTNFLVPFYNYILSELGFKNIKSLKVIPLTKKDIRRTYIEQNKTNYWVCPACLGEIHLVNIKDETTTSGYITDSCTDIEHYMPKSIYPALIISSDNLIPICKECNQVIKNDKNPLDHNEEGCVNNMFLPYRDSGIDQIEIKITGIGGNRRLKIEAKDKTNVTLIRKTNNFKRIYKLEEQWTPRLEHIHNSIVSSIVSDLKYDDDDVTHENLTKLLKKIIHRAERSKKTNQNSFLQKSYAEWLLENRFIQLYDEINEQF